MISIMKKHIFIIITTIIILLSLIATLFFITRPSKFSFESKYYEKSEMIEISLDKLNTLIDEKESFGVFLYQPACNASADFNKVLTQFQGKYKMFFYKIPFSQFKESKYGEKIKYYPSFVIFNKGEIVDFLESDKDEDTEAFTTLEGFAKWISKHVVLGEENKDYNNVRDESNTNNKNLILEEVNLKKVKKEPGKVNIYFFHGDGCPHCADLQAFLNSIKSEYGKYFNLYKYEVWKNEYNNKLMYTFANALGDNPKGVPYFIIGDVSYNGFSEDYKAGIIETIEALHDKDNDIYFDKLKKDK